jgi:hypothetical protein
MSRAPRSALKSDKYDIAGKLQTFDATTVTSRFLCKKNTRLKNLFDDAWKFNGRLELPVATDY